MQKNGESQPSSTSSLSALNADREKRALIAKRLASLPDDKRRQLGERLAEEGIDIWQLPIAATDVEKPVLSFAQQRLWFLDKTQPGNTLYNLFFGLHFYGDINIEWLEKSLNLIVERHEALRTNIKEVAGVAYQDVQPFSALKIDCVELDALCALEERDNKTDRLSVEEKLAKVAKQQAEEPFDLQQDALFRFLLIKVTDDHYAGLFTIHHLIFDAYSVENFCIELSQAYRALATQKDHGLANIAIQYKDYALWQQRWSETEHCQRQLSYWQQQLDGAPERLNLSIANAIDPVSHGDQKHRGGERSIAFPANLSQQITQLAQEHNSTLYMLMLAMFNLLLSRYSGEQDICIGTSIANRDRLEIEPLIGFFVNLLVMRNQVDAQISFDEFLGNVSATATDAYAHQEIPFDKLVDAQRQQGGSASLFQVLFVMNNAGLDTELSLPGLRIRPYEKPIERARYDLTLRVYEQAINDGESTELHCHIEYDTDLFDGKSIDSMLLHYQRLFQSLFEKGVSTPLEELEYLDAADKQEQLELAKGPAFIRSIEKDAELEWNFLHQKFEQHAAANPDAISVVYESESVTYGDLNARANRVAHYLRKQDMGAESKVGLYLDRSVHLIEAILGVLKAGAAYVPLDTTWPNTRIQQIMADADISVVLTEQQWQNEINESIDGSLKTYSLDANNQLWSAYPDTNPEPINSPNDAAYVIYTSGSTGVPKGVVVEHRQIINYAQAIVSRLELESDLASFGHISTIAADLGNTSLYGALCFGGTLHLIDSSRAFDPDAVVEQFMNHPVDVLKIVPGHLQGLLAAENAKMLLPRQCLILGGEACPIDLIKQVQSLAPSLRIINHYGPSETTVGVLAHEITDKDVCEKSIPIGTPLANCQTYVLDQAQQLTPTGIAGELYVGGANVARGYLNNSEQTRERFIENPFAENTEYGRLYRTGDRVKRNQRGEIIFLGRMDNQVKVRGYRVELGDIESAINRQPVIVESVVRLVKGGLSDQLVAYVVFERQVGSEQELIAQLIGLLEQQLPEYMVPQRIEVIDALPRTANGKIDSKQLDALAADKKITEYRAPRNEMEQALVDVWQQVLKHDSIGIDDNFFALGGDSILSLQVIARAKRAGIKFTPKQFFDTQTIAQLAEVAQTLGEDAVANYDVVVGDLPLTPIQHWFFEQNHTQPQHWNQSLLLEAKQPLNIDALRQAVSLLVKHHDQLRAEFSQDSSACDIQQRVLDWSEEAGEQYFYTDAWLQSAPESEADSNEDGSEVDKTAYFIERVNHWQASLNFESEESVGQLFKVIAFESDHENGDSVTPDRLLIVAHHLLIDGVSWRVLMEDLYSAYKYYLQPAVVRSKQCPLDGKTTSFKHWSEYLPKLVQQSDAEWHKASSDYWGNIEKRLDPTSALIQPQDLHSKLADVKQHNLRVDSETTNALLKDAPKAYQTTINDLLLAALILAFTKQRNTETLYLELEGHGRESIDKFGYEANQDIDISRTLGWFTSRFPLLLDGISTNDSDRDTQLSVLIKSVKEQLRAIPVNGMPYGLLKYMGDLPTRHSYSPLVSFNYLGQINTDQTEENSANDLFAVERKSPSIVERHPDNKVTHGLSINAIVTDGELNIAWHYLEEIVADMLDLDVEQLASDYQQSITEIVAHCGNELRAFTPTDFPLAGLNQAQLDQLAEKIDIQKIQDIYPLTPMQEGLMLHTLLAPKSGIYFMQYRYQLLGRFDHELFTEAWRLVVARHEVLRTAFVQQDDQSLQIVYSEAKSPVEILDWRDLSANEQQARLAEWMQERVEESFDLSIPTQLAITLIRIDEDRYQLVRSFHHILMDAWCFGLLLNDFLHFYQSLVNKQRLSLPQPRPYRDYIDWLQDRDIEKTENYWRQTLAGFEAPTPMVIDSPQKDSGVQDHVTWLSEEQTAWLHKIAKQKQITVNTIVQGAWGLLLSRYSGNSDIVFGVTVAGRPTEMDDADTIIGLFINSLPLRVNVELDHSAEQYLQDILAINHQMREHEHAPLADIQRLSDVEPGKALFDSLFVYENASVEGVVSDKGIDFELIDSDNRTHTNYPITVVVYPKQQLGLQLTYDKSKFADEAVARMLEHFERAVLNIAHALAADSSVTKDTEKTSLESIEILSEHEQRQLLVDWNQTYTDYPRQQCWQELFIAQVKKTPNAIAVLCGEKSLTYHQLYQQALAVAQELVRSEVQPDDVVAVLDQRDIDLLVMIAGVLLAGAAYLPLDPKHPEQRLAQVLSTSQVKTALVGIGYQDLFNSALAQLDLAASEDQPCVIVFDEAIKQSQNDERKFRYSPDHLAYVIYTSGSTGVPKGAMVEHRGMLNNVYAKISQLSLTSEDVIAQTASQCFDISVWQFLTGLLCGAKIRIYPDEIAHNPMQLLERVDQDSVTILESVPSLIHSFIELAPPISTLRWLIPTGEALTPDLAKQWLTQYPQIPLMNAYGPAECADDVALWPIHNVNETEVPSIPIGTPTDNNRLYVLSENRQMQPVGVPGEIYVAGAGVGRGYLNDPERTAAAFVDNFLLEHPQHSHEDISRFDQPTRLYRTGDLGRWRADGVLEFQGRTDHQIKIRGYRIELGEVEAAIEAFAGIHLAAALVKTDPRGEQCIVAYYEPISEPALENDLSHEIEEELRQHIAETLPAYMMPTVVVQMPAIPINDNGKIDRHALPEPDFGRVETQITEPRTDLERQLVGLWQEILKIDRIDIHTNFFALGGHSLLAIRLHAKVCQSFEVELPLRNVFERNSVAEVAEQIELAKAVEQLAAAPDIADEVESSVGIDSDASSDAVDDQDFEEFEL